jgi:class 3 adenylate cyclase
VNADGLSWNYPTAYPVRTGGRIGGGWVTAIAACRTCGTEPLENARFCHSCGSPVQDGDTRAEYKQVTVLFADVVHSMDIASAVGAERLREIMADLADRCAAVVQRYGSTVAQFTGDGIMAVFGAPVALEDHAIRACLAALGVQEEAKRLAVDVGERDRVDLRLRVGLNSGEVIAGEIGSGAFGYTAVGEQVGMAQRMESVRRRGKLSGHGEYQEGSGTQRTRSGQARELQVDRLDTRDGVNGSGRGPPVFDPPRV